MISQTKYSILNRISFWTRCRICGKRNRRYRYCGGDNGCVNGPC